MKKLPLLTAAAVATGVMLYAPDAKACEDCDTGGGDWQQCTSGSPNGFGACYVSPQYDECGVEIGSDCMVYYDAFCDMGSGSSWSGPWSWDSWVCWAFSWSDCSEGGFAE